MDSTAALQALDQESPVSDGIRARPCFEICAYYDRPRLEGVPELLRTLLAFVSASGGSFGWYKTSTMKHAAAVPASAAEVLSGFFSSGDVSRPGTLGIEIHSGDRRDDFAPPALMFFSAERKDEKGKPLSRAMLRLCLPVEAARDARALFASAAAWGSEPTPYCGHGAYSLYWNIGDTRMERLLGQRKGLLLNRPVMSYHDPFAFYPFIGQGVLQVGWLTFLGPALLEALGGIERLRSSPASEVGVSTLRDGQAAVLVAGREPVLGSRHPDDEALLAPYRAVGSVLAPLQLEDSAFEFLDLAGFDDEDETRDWCLRFFREGDE